VHSSPQKRAQSIASQFIAPEATAHQKKSYNPKEIENIIIFIF
jgi:hypothetical protein